MKKRIEDTTGSTALLSVPEAAQRLSIGVTVTKRLAKENGCFLKIGKTARVNISKLEEIVLALYTVQE